MNKLSICALLVTASLAASCGTSQLAEQEFEIKGIQLGMNIEEAVKGREDLVIDPVMGWVKGASSFTLAGIETGSAFVAYQKDGVINGISATFPSDKFGVIRSAFQSKYPAIDCKTEQVALGPELTTEMTNCSAQRVRAKDELVVTDKLVINEYLPIVSKLKQHKVGKIAITTNEEEVIRRTRQGVPEVERVDPKEDI